MKIPRILHHIWLGEKPLPEEFQQFRQGWIDKHPGWGFHLWTEKNLPEMVNHKLFEAAQHPAEKSDILRLELLHQFGGLYVDTDFECLKNVEPLLAGETCVLARMTDKPMTTGFMACLPGEPLFARCIAALPSHVASHAKKNLYRKTGPGYINRFVREFPDIKVLEPYFVYPYEPRTLDTKQLWAEHGAAAFPDAYAAHHWSGSWLALEFGRIDLKSERVVIIGRGPSLKGFDFRLISELPESVTVICVNHAIESSLRADVWFTLDPSAEVQVLMNSQRPGTRYVAAVPADFGQKSARCREHRKTAPKNITYLHRLKGKGPQGSKEGLSKLRDSIHTGNSGYGALQLATLMGAKQIVLLGIDGPEDGCNTGGHFDSPGRTKDLSHLPQLFASAVPDLQAAGVEVLNGSANSKITCFPRCSPQAAIKWIAGE